jgi:glycosyltransferase involved in cell wall biosynthesis
MARVFFTCAASPDYIRNRALVRALRREHEVKVVASTAATYPRRLAAVLPRVLMAAGGFDVYLAGFLGQPLVPFLRARRLRPIVLDAFISVYDTLCLDRRTFDPRSPAGRVFHWLDTSALQSARCVLTDTPASADFMAQEFGVPRSKLMPVPVGADESLFYPRRGPDGPTVKVLYACTYLPLHGAPVVIEAANLLRDKEGIRFTLIGKGPERPRAEGLARRYGLTNCRFIDWVPFEELPARIAACHIFLGGHFNAENAKARRVVPGKVYQGLAMATPTIIGDCEASQQWFRHGESAYTVPMGDARALADAILELAGSPHMRDRIGEGGRALYEQQFSEAAIASLLNECIGRLAGAD